MIDVITEFTNKSFYRIDDSETWFNLKKLESTEFRSNSIISEFTNRSFYRF